MLKNFWVLKNLNVVCATNRNPIIAVNHVIIRFAATALQDVEIAAATYVVQMLQVRSRYLETNVLTS